MRNLRSAFTTARFSVLVGVVLTLVCFNDLRMRAQDETVEQCSLIALRGPSIDPNDTSKYLSERDIFVMNPDGSNLHRITDTADDEVYPAWSPDGQFIVFSSNRDRKGERGYGYWVPQFNLYIMNSDGSHVRRLTRFEDSSDDLEPVWSPDGKWIVHLYWAERGAPHRIAITGLNGERYRSFDLANPIDPSWSPDSTHILYSGPVETEPDRMKLHLVDVESGHVTQLTDGGGDDTEASFSPDGQWIVFASTRDKPKHIEFSLPDIYMMNYATRDVKRLTTDGGFGPSWSPDGSQIAYNGPGGINVMNSDGTDRKLILADNITYNADTKSADHTSAYVSPVWSPWLCTRR